MRRALLMGAAAAVLLSAGLAAQGRNFGGTWTIDTEKTAAAGGGGGGRGGGGGGGAVVARSGGAGGGAVAAGGTGGAVMATGGGGARGGGGAGCGAVARTGGGGGGAMITTAGMTLALDANTFTITQGQMSTTYHTDGSTTNLDTAGRKASAKAAWQGDKLVIETTTESANGTMVTQATWYLDGDSLVRENKTTTPDGQEITRKTFFKRGTSN